ncbi:hypothetical protein [uncultured Tateyamaria sp.]|uniref:hypothetical protein n=1 Tax=uncultured Tateyamaria sp. TaxID=455651 RepID=UPI002636D2ED|nr:hypothetical protein [uncultured Tateyamaria sp.]
MKKIMSGFAVSLAIMSSSSSAEVLLTVDGREYTLTALMENCQTLVKDPAKQIACFNAVSTLLEQQTSQAEPETPTDAPAALEALRTVAQYEGDDSGLIIRGTDCNAQILYYANYFHISRRNVSSIDLFSTRFDASKVDHDKISRAAGGQALVSKGAMHSGAIAASIGGQAMDSAQYGIAPKSARMTVADYAVEMAEQLTATESSEFDFVLVHPAKQQSSTQIWNAFDAYLAACQG